MKESEYRPVCNRVKSLKMYSVHCTLCSLCLQFVKYLSANALKQINRSPGTIRVQLDKTRGESSAKIPWQM